MGLKPFNSLIKDLTNDLKNDLKYRPNLHASWDS